ncbi:unnamed protein product [Penicillium olsonii]|nr:unnamed protein product [Penicillium olsonii]
MSPKPVDEPFVKALPKIELHAHLSGSISRQCLHEIWLQKKQKDPEFPVEDPLLLMPPGKVDYTLETFFSTFSKLTYQLCNDLESLVYATRSVLEDFLNDGVVYLELRTIPRASAGISREQYVETVLGTIEAFKSRNSGMAVFLILAIDRGNMSAVEAGDIINLAIENKPRGVVGVDICGNPTRGDVSIFKDSFSKAKMNDLGITLHFGETAASGSPSELETLLSFQPDRIGHVIHVPEDIKKEIVRRKLGLELCMSCNVHAKMINGGFLDHHFGYWRHEDCPVVLCTDDVGFFCSPVSNEHLLAAHHFDLSRGDLLAMTFKAVDAIFSGQEHRDKIRRDLALFASRWEVESSVDFEPFEHSGVHVIPDWDPARCFEPQMRSPCLSGQLLSQFFQLFNPPSCPGLFLVHSTFTWELQDPIMSSGALPQTLKSITATKINELSKQRVIFDQHKSEILAASKAAKDLGSRAQILLDGISHLKGYPKDSLDIDDDDLDAESETDSDISSSEPGAGRLQRADHANIRRFLLQSRYDSSISQASIQSRISLLEKDLRYLEIKHEHGAFYSKLVTEWLSELDGNTASTADESETSQSTSDSGFEPVGRTEMHEQRATWESLVFNPATHVKEDVISSYLLGLFAQTKLSRQALKKMQTSIQSFGADLLSKGSWFDVHTLKWVSEALLKADLLNDQKAAILKEFMRNTEVAQEVADVLNMRLASLESWSWTTDADGIPLEMRRQLNGKYRFYMDEDLLDALMLQYLGTKWAVQLRKVFVEFLHSREWKPLRDDVSEEYVNKRKFSFGRHGIITKEKINDLRRTTYEKEYFMSQLPMSEQEGAREYDAEDDDQAKNPLDTKHSLLHLLITESVIHKHQHGGFTALRSDFEWFGPSMPHATVLAVMKIFGFSETWLKFFKSFLEAPLKFTQDGAEGAVQTRKRGLPMSHTLGDCFGEVVLFCMDYAVNQHADGAFLYRLHDDFWFWGAEDTCDKAWKAMEKFSQVMGLSFNKEKTGTVRMGNSKGERSSTLPRGDIRWGFLVLDAAQERFIIDQTEVDKHIEELSRQLSSCKSVFAWVQAWNTYFGRFFTNNFAKPAVCFGRDHIDMAISTLNRIERTLFNKGADAESNKPVSGVAEYLRAVIGERFNIQNLPDGFFYYPVELGGLGLLNPFIRLLAMRENIKTTPRKLLHKATLKEEVEYETAKEHFKKNGGADSTGSGVDFGPGDFMSFEEYTRYPETFSGPLRDVYNQLNEVPQEKKVPLTLGFSREQDSLGNDVSQKASITDSWGQMTPYWCWVAELYYEEMVQTYGSLAAVNREFMPLGVVKTLREGRFRWQG